MMSVGLRIEQSDGTLRDELDALSGRWTRAFADQARGEVQLLRDDWADVEADVDERNDRLFILEDGSKTFGGRFDDVQTNGSEVTLRINSPEIDAMDAQPTGANVIYQNVDAETIATDAIDAVGTLSRGTINLSATGISYTISHGSQSKILYDLMEQAGAEFRYNADWSVDVVDSLGSDLSGSVLLGPAQSNLGTGFRKTVDERENVTHVEGLGGESGPSQVTATAVAPSFSGGREKWRRYKNKEVIDKSRLQDIVDELVAEYDGEPRFIEISATVYDEKLALGDSVPIHYPEENIDRTLRVVKLSTHLTRQQGKRLEATLSNRLRTRTSRSGKRNDDLERFNRGFGGFVDRDNHKALESQPVTASDNATGSYFYPNDVVREDRAEVVVRSLPYRAYSSGGAASGDETTQNNSDFDWTQQEGFNKVITLHANSVSSPISFSPDVRTAEVRGFASINVDGADLDGTITEITPQMENVDTGEKFPSIGAPMEWRFNDSNESGWAHILATDPTNCENQTLQWNYYNGDSKDLTVRIAEYWEAIGPHTHNQTAHTHPAEPGLTEFATETASGVDLLINGSTVSADIGSGEFETVVDVRGEFTPGVNDIELASDTLGRTSATVRTELFRRGE